MKRNLSLLLVVSALFAADPSFNPLSAGFNQKVEFGKLLPEHIKISAESIIADSRKALQVIYSVPKERRTFQNTLSALDDALNSFAIITSQIYLMANAHPDKAMREQTLAALDALDKFENEMGLDEKLYAAVKEFSLSAEAKLLTGYKRRFLDRTIRDFERSGFALSKEKRSELKTIQDRISELGTLFGRNIAEAQDTLLATEEEVAGLPEDYKKSRKTADGKFKIDLSYPSYLPFMKYSKSESARKMLYLKNNNRAVPNNLEVLKKLVLTRKDMANLLGYTTYAQYTVEERMAKKPDAVWQFENALIDKAKEKARRDYNELLEIKRNYTNDRSIQSINPWESGFYNNLLLEQRYSVNDEKIKEYFELNNVMSGLFGISQKLFDVEFSEVKNPSVWSPDVRMFAVKKEVKVIAHFYLDLFPRANKYGHAACFTMVKGKMTSAGYQMPLATLECNFPTATADRPSLMYHAAGSASVETFFHEFGHVLHNILTTAELYSHSGTSVPRDFVEAPSQIFENWVWNYDVLKTFAKHYKTGEVLPKEMFDKMLAAKNVGSGLATLQQIFYGMIDMNLNDTWDPEKETTSDVVKRVQTQVTLFPYLEGTHMEASFGHLNGYAAGYYGYLWSKVYSQDMFSLFHKNGLMDRKTGARYRDIILARGGSQDPLELVKEFLGREPNQDAFLKDLGL